MSPWSPHGVRDGEEAHGSCCPLPSSQLGVAAICFIRNLPKEGFFQGEMVLSHELLSLNVCEQREKKKLNSTVWHRPWKLTMFYWRLLSAAQGPDIKTINISKVLHVMGGLWVRAWLRRSFLFVQALHCLMSETSFCFFFFCVCVKQLFLG